MNANRILSLSILLCCLLEPGRYLVSAGASSEDATVRAIGGAGGFYQRTFHPDAVEEAQAKKKGYVATGRVIESETGKPVPGVMLGYNFVKKTMGSFGKGNSITNSLGEFRLEGLSPNTYSVYVLNEGQSDLYSEPATFEIVGGDVTGIEIRMSRSSQISGTAMVEGTRDPAVLANLTRIQVYARNVQRDQTAMIMSRNANPIGANGAFSVGDVRPGKVQLVVSTFDVKGLSLIRIEHNGVEVKEFDVVPGEPITGVRLVFVYGNAMVAGRVEIKGGRLPPGTRLLVLIRREGAASGGISGLRPAEVDNRGQFLLEGLAQGSYKLSLYAYNLKLGAPPNIPKVEQMVTVSSNARQEVTLTLDLSQKEGEIGTDRQTRPPRHLGCGRTRKAAQRGRSGECRDRAESLPARDRLRAAVSEVKLPLWDKMPSCPTIAPAFDLRRIFSFNFPPGHYLSYQP